MIRNAPATSNIERQRQFRERNPGYYNKYTRRHSKAARLKRLAAMQAAAVVAEAEKAQQAAQTPAMPLMLPAPAEIPLIPGMNAIAELPTRTIAPAVQSMAA